MCLYPKLIKNKKYESTKKNGGIIPAIFDSRVLAVPIGCGNCIECKKKKAREWQVRLLEDVKKNKNGKFITITFSNESIKELTEALDKENGYRLKGYELDNEIARIGVRRWLERWRKKNKKSLRHWLVTELGHNGTENIHMHGIVWSDKPISEIRDSWRYGYIYPRTESEDKVNFVSEKTVNYITKYVSKVDFKHKEYKSKILTSAGIGGGYKERADAGKNEYKKGETKEYYVTKSGHKMMLPIYYRNAIYTDEEKEKLWIEKLDKQERYVGGRKISIKNGEEEYYEAVRIEREKNKRLGYGTGTEDWNRKKYEEERRNLLHQKRIENVQIKQEINKQIKWGTPETK